MSDLRAVLTGYPPFLQPLASIQRWPDRTELEFIVSLGKTGIDDTVEPLDIDAFPTFLRSCEQGVIRHLDHEAGISGPSLVNAMDHRRL